MVSERRSPEERWRRAAVVSWALIGMLALLAAGLWMLGRIGSALTPVVLALVVIFVLRRPVAKLESRGMNRSLAVGLCYLLMLGGLVVAGLFVIPAVIREITEFVEEFPRFYDALYSLWLDVQREYLAIQMPQWVSDAIVASRESLVEWSTRASATVAQTVVAVGGQMLGLLVATFLAFALAFFVLRDLPTLRSELLALPGPARREDTVKLFSEVAGVLEGFLRGQLLIATGLGIVTGLGLWVLGVPYAAVIGLIAGVTNLVPYVGPVIGGAVAAISAVFVSPQLMLYTVIWIVVVQQIESLILQPRIMANQVHLHPALVILSVTIGATLLGFVGMLIALPVAAVIKVLFVHYYEKLTEVRITTDDGALFRTPRARRSPAAECEEPVPDADCDEDERGDDPRELS